MAATKDLPVCYSGEIHPLFFFWPILFLRESKIIGIFSGFMEYSGRASPVAMPRALPASRELHSLQYRSRARLTVAPSMGMGDGDPRLPRDLFLWSALCVSFFFTWRCHFYHSTQLCDPHFLQLVPSAFFVRSQ
jgi:hypothetical protein